MGVWVKEDVPEDDPRDVPAQASCGAPVCVAGPSPQWVADNEDGLGHAGDGEGLGGTQGVGGELGQVGACLRVGGWLRKGKMEAF